MNGVTIGGIHCYKDLGMFLSAADIGMPEVETITIDVPGRAGILDCTEKIFGGPAYKSRVISLQLQPTVALTAAKRESLRSTISNAWHGKTKRIVFDSDPLYFYEGRIEVGQFTVNGPMVTIPVTCTCKPYKYLISDPTQKSL